MQGEKYFQHYFDRQTTLFQYVIKTDIVYDLLD
jgi:hypothetical protein